MEITEDVFKKYQYHNQEQRMYAFVNAEGLSAEGAREANSKYLKFLSEKNLKEQVKNNEERHKDEKFIIPNGKVSVFSYYYYYCKGMLIIRARKFADHYDESGKSWSYEEYCKESWKWSLQPLEKELWDKRF